MSIIEIQAEILRLARDRVVYHVHRRQLSPQLQKLAQESGRSLAWCQAAFESAVEDVIRGDA